jgi:hypothetical protein
MLRLCLNLVSNKNYMRVICTLVAAAKYGVKPEETVQGASTSVCQTLKISVVHAYPVTGVREIDCEPGTIIPLVDCACALS